MEEFPRSLTSVADWETLSDVINRVNKTVDEAHKKWSSGRGCYLDYVYFAEFVPFLDRYIIRHCADFPFEQNKKDSHILQQNMDMCTLLFLLRMHCLLIAYLLKRDYSNHEKRQTEQLTAFDIPSVEKQLLSMSMAPVLSYTMSELYHAFFRLSARWNELDIDFEGDDNDGIAEYCELLQLRCAMFLFAAYDDTAHDMVEFRNELPDTTPQMYCMNTNGIRTFSSYLLDIQSGLIMYKVLEKHFLPPSLEVEIMQDSDLDGMILYEHPNIPQLRIESLPSNTATSDCSRLLREYSRDIPSAAHISKLLLMLQKYVDETNTPTRLQRAFIRECTNASLRLGEKRRFSPDNPLMPDDPNNVMIKLRGHWWHGAVQELSMKSIKQILSDVRTRLEKNAPLKLRYYEKVAILCTMDRFMKSTFQFDWATDVVFDHMAYLSGDSRVYEKHYPLILDLCATTFGVLHKDEIIIAPTLLHVIVIWTALIRMCFQSRFLHHDLTNLCILLDLETSPYGSTFDASTSIMQWMTPKIKRREDPEDNEHEHSVVSRQSSVQIYDVYS
jgi:hypothetical protein